ncbi:MAG: hypothetical protein H0X30_20440 [Anaerolineae bacterium]|nr:hypothetical protein [Anaerolineae bacterium]
MSRQLIYIPADSPDVWQSFLAEPALQWKTGYSARTLAHAWHAQTGFPKEVERILNQSDFAAFQRVTPLIMLPEYKVPLKGRGKDSQNDLFVLAKADDNQLVSMTIEGKVEESFGSTIHNWKQSGEGYTENKRIRLEYLQETLGLEAIHDSIYYQLLHRCASAVIEAKRFNARYAVMLVHSFSPQGSWFNEYAQFIALYGQQAVKDKLFHLASLGDVELYSGWVTGNPKYLSF